MALQLFITEGQANSSIEIRRFVLKIKAWKEGSVK
jgi:hypothetical protein